jgi:hypothetical protein
MRSIPKFLAVAAGLACAATLAFAADQTILGKSMIVKDPSSGNDATKRRVNGSGKEKGSPNTIVGNPTLAGSAGGAILEVFAFGGTSSNQSFVLPQGTSISGKPFWSEAGSTGFRYKDGKGEQGPVKTVLIKKSPGGVFTVKAKITGKNGPVSIVPPNPGSAGCVALKLGIAPSAGDRYSLQFGPDSVIKNVSSKLFKAKRPAFEGVCTGGGPTTTTTTTPTTTSTTTTTLYGSASRAFLERPVDLLD